MHKNIFKHKYLLKEKELIIITQKENLRYTYNVRTFICTYTHMHIYVYI